MEFDQSFSTLFIKKAEEEKKTPAPAPAPTPAPAPSESKKTEEKIDPNKPLTLDDLVSGGGFKIEKKQDNTVNEIISKFIETANRQGKSGDVARDFILQKKTNIQQLTALVGPDDAIKYYKDLVEVNQVSLENAFKILESAIGCSFTSGVNTRDIIDFAIAFTKANRDPTTLTFIMDEACALASIDPNIKPFQMLKRAITGEKFDSGDSTFFKFDNPVHSAMLNRLMSLATLTKQTDDVLQSDEAARIIESLENAKQLMSIERDLNNYLLRGEYAKSEADAVNHLRNVFKGSLNDPFAQALRRMYFIFDVGQNVTQQMLMNAGISSVPESKKYGPKFQKKSNRSNFRLAQEGSPESTEKNTSDSPDQSFFTNLKKIFEENVGVFKEIKSILDNLKTNPTLAPIVNVLLQSINLFVDFDKLVAAIKDGSISSFIEKLKSIPIDLNQIQDLLGGAFKSAFSQKFIKISQATPTSPSLDTLGSIGANFATQALSTVYILKFLKQTYSVYKTLTGVPVADRTEGQTKQLNAATSNLLKIISLLGLYVVGFGDSIIGYGKKQLKPRDAPYQADNYEWAGLDNAEASQLRNVEIAWKKSVAAAKSHAKILQADANSQIATDLQGGKAPAPISSPGTLEKSFKEFRKTLSDALNFTYYFQELLKKAYDKTKSATDPVKDSQFRAKFLSLESGLAELKQLDTEYASLEEIIGNLQAIAIIYRDLEPDMQQALNFNEIGVGVPALLGYKGIIGKIDQILQQRVEAQKKLQQSIINLEANQSPNLVNYTGYGKEESTDPTKNVKIVTPSSDVQTEAKDRKLAALKAQLAKMETEIAKIDGYKRKLLKGEFSKFNNKSNKFIKLSDKPVSFDDEEFEFYDNLLGDPSLEEPAGYGTILEDPEKYRNTPSTEVKPKFRRVNQV